MSERFTIEIPDSHAKYMRQLAQLTGKTIEEILAEAILHPVPPIAFVEDQIAQVKNIL